MPRPESLWNLPLFVLVRVWESVVPRLRGMDSVFLRGTITLHVVTGLFLYEYANDGNSLVFPQNC